MNEGVKMDATVVLTMGRVGFSETFKNTYQSMMRFGLPVCMTQSPYWEQALTGAIKGALKSGSKYLLFFDGDSVWDQDDLYNLYKLIEDTGVDAVVPVQSDRNADKPLAYNWLAEAGIKYDYTGPVTPILHGHFGMTFIRSEVFRTLPEPWFWSQPGQKGTWELSPDNPGKKDGDTFFWIRFHEHGKRAVQANHTVVGHMELMVRWQRGGQVQSQTLSEFHKNGRPYGLRTPYQHELPEGAKNSAEASVKKPEQELQPGMMPEDAVTAAPDSPEMAETRATAEAAQVALDETREVLARMTVDPVTNGIIVEDAG